MDTMINTATSTFQTTTGFSLASVVDWSTTNLVTLFIGSGLGVLYELRVWIVAFLMLSICIYFAFRAFQYFRA